MYRLAAATIGLTATAGLAEFASRPSSLNVFEDFKSNISALFGHSEELGEESRWKNVKILTITAKAKALLSESAGIENHERAVNRRNEIMKYGYPTLDNIKIFDDFILAYSNVHKGPLWVCEHLADYNVNISNKEVNRSQSKFVSDNSVDPMFRSYNSDFLGSGFDRGHLAAAANHRQSQIAMNETFHLSNICPQIGKGLNRSKWNELEKRARALSRKHGSSYVLTGPLYLPTVVGSEKFVKYKLIGDNNVAVPTHFFKVIVAQTQKGGFILESYVMPNEEIRDDIPISSYLVPKSSVEKGAGFLIFDYIADSQYCTINGQSNPDFIGP